MPKISDSDLIINPDGSVYHLAVKPEDITQNIIAVGDPGRVFKISQYFDSIDFELNHREFVTHRGKYKGKELTVMSTGMGTDNVEIFLTELDALVNIDFETRQIKEQKTELNIVRVGTSGALQADIELGAHLATEYAIGLDTLMSFYQFEPTGYEKSIGEQVQRLAKLPFTPYCVNGSQKLIDQIAFDMVKGNTLTSPGFYAPQGRSLRLGLKNEFFLDALTNFSDGDFRLTNFEMETAGYYSLGRMLGHQVLSLNAILANRPSGRFADKPEKIVDELIRKVLDRI